MNEKIKGKDKGITLIALVITIIVLLILAGVALNAISGENGIINNAKKAKSETEKAALIEEINIKIAKALINEDTLTEEKLTDILDDYGTIEGEGNIKDKTLIVDGTEIKISEIYKDEIELKKYSVIFYNYDGTTELYKVTNVTQGSSITYEGEETTREADDDYIYTFLGWGTTQNDETSIVELTNIQSNMTLYALYTKQAIPTYTVTFCDEDGTTLYTATVKSGETAVYGGTTPTKSGYTFSTWVTESGGDTVAEFENVTSDMTVYAAYITTSTCFISGTKILTENGLLNIEDIKVGMKVYSRNMISGETELKEVKQKFEYKVTKDMAKVYVNGEIIESTIEHPYYVVNKGWTVVSKIKAGDVLLKANGEKVIIEKVEIIKNDGTQINTVYNFEVEDNHNYYVGEQSILAHNKGHSEAIAPL